MATQYFEIFKMIGGKAIAVKGVSTAKAAKEYISSQTSGIWGYRSLYKCTPNPPEKEPKEDSE